MLKDAVFKIVPSSLSATGQGICDSLMIAVAGIVSSVAAGWMIEYSGVPFFMFFCIGTQLLTILLLVIHFIFAKGSKI